jgi:hypothetical protein
MDDMKAIGAIASSVAAAGTGGSITVATITAPAPGILGVVGLTTTTTVALPAAGIVAVAGLAYGAYRGIQMAQGK